MFDEYPGIEIDPEFNPNDCDIIDIEEEVN